jgi:cytochrome b involved in lipid metabolism
MNEQHLDGKYRKITAEELAVHCSKESAWLSLDGVVYDVTVYLKYHPGGLIMLEGCGRECGNLFSKDMGYIDEYHPWVNGKYLLEKYKIGFVGR